MMRVHLDVHRLASVERDGHCREYSGLHGAEHALWEPVLLPPTARCDCNNIAGNLYICTATHISQNPPYLLHSPTIHLFI